MEFQSKLESNWSLTITVIAVSFPVFWKRIKYSKKGSSLRINPSTPTPFGRTDLSLGS